MKRLFILLAFLLLLSVPAFAVIVGQTLVVSTGGVTIWEAYSGGSGTGEDDNDQTQSWTMDTAQGHTAANYDDSNTTNAIDTEDLALTGTDWGRAYVTLASAHDDVSIAWMMTIGASETDAGYAGCSLDKTGLADYSNALIGMVRWSWDGSAYDPRPYYNEGADNTTITAANLPRGSTFYMRLDYEKGTGANAVYRIAYATTKPTKDADWTETTLTSSGTSTDQVQGVQVYSNIMTCHIDEIVLNTDGTKAHW